MAYESEFNLWWSQYPRKVGKLAAEKAYRLVRKNGAPAQDIQDGLERYLQVLPADRQFIPHPRTWLAQGRWMDEGNLKFRLEEIPWWDECQQAHGGVCRSRYDHVEAMTHGLLPSQRKA